MNKPVSRTCCHDTGANDADQHPPDSLNRTPDKKLALIDDMRIYECINTVSETFHIRSILQRGRLTSFGDRLFVRPDTRYESQNRTDFTVRGPARLIPRLSCTANPELPPRILDTSSETRVIAR